MTGGGSAFWILLYGLFYWASRLSLGSFTSVVLYLGYLFLICLFDFLVTGASFCDSYSPFPQLIVLRNDWVPRILLGCA